jgi:type IV pilus assembly protein PilM
VDRDELSERLAEILRLGIKGPEDEPPPEPSQWDGSLFSSQADQNEAKPLPDEVEPDQQRDAPEESAEPEADRAPVVEPGALNSKSPEQLEAERIRREDRRRKRLIKKQRPAPKPAKKKAQDKKPPARKQKERSKKPDLAPEKTVKVKKPRVDHWQKWKESWQAARAQRSRRLRKDIVGLDIGSSTLRATLLKEGQALEVHHCPLPPGVIVNGVVEEPEELSRQLRALWKQSGLKSKKVNIGMKNRGLLVRTKTTAASDPRDIDQVVAVSSKRLFEPLNPETLIVDYTELTRSGKKNRLQVAAANRQSTKRLTKAVEKAGLLTVCCEIGPLAAQRAVVSPRYSDQLHLVVDIGAETTSVAACSGPDVFYLRIIEIGGDDLTAALAKRQGLPWTAAEEVKYQINLASGSVDPEVSAAVDRLINEIEKSKEQAEAEVGMPVASWTALGGGSLLPGLTERVTRLSSLPAALPPVPHPRLPDPAIIEHAPTLGLAIGHQMSLLPTPEASGFNITAPGLRRKPKVKVDKYRRQGRRLAQSSSSRFDARLLGLILALLIPLAAYLLGSGPRKEVEEVQQQAVNLQAQVQGPDRAEVVYRNSSAATEAARIVSSRPAQDSLAGVIDSVVGAGGSDLSVKVNGPQFVVSARVPRDVSADLNNTTGNVSGVEEFAVSYQEGQVKITVETAPRIEANDEP